MRCLFPLLTIFMATSIISCNSNLSRKQALEDCIVDFNYYKTEAVGPENMASILYIKNKDLLEILINNPRELLYTYRGGIYDIDSLYFPPPLIEIYSFKDSSLIFEQDVFGLRGYSNKFIDSIMTITKEQISIEFTDTLTTKKWIITRCR